MLDHDEQRGGIRRQVEDVLAALERRCGAHGRVAPGRESTVIGAFGDRQELAKPGASRASRVSGACCRSSESYKLAHGRRRRQSQRVIQVRGRRIGGEHFGLIAGPLHGRVAASRPSRRPARSADAGATMLRGGAFKPRTSPYSFQRPRRSRRWPVPRGGARGDRATVRHRGDGSAPCRGGGRRDRRASRSARATCRTSCLLAEVGQDRQAGAAEARRVSLDRGAADGGRVHPQGGQPASDPLRARHQDLRALHPLHARHRRGAGAQGGDAPAGDRRPLARGRPARARARPGPGGRGRRRRRHHRGGAPDARGRRSATRLSSSPPPPSRSSPTTSRASSASWARRSARPKALAQRAVDLAPLVALLERAALVEHVLAAGHGDLHLGAAPEKYTRVGTIVSPFSAVSPTRRSISRRWSSSLRGRSASWFSLRGGLVRAPRACCGARPRRRAPRRRRPSAGPRRRAST